MRPDILSTVLIRCFWCVNHALGRLGLSSRCVSRTALCLDCPNPRIASAFARADYQRLSSLMVVQLRILKAQALGGLSGNLNVVRITLSELEPNHPVVENVMTRTLAASLIAFALSSGAVSAQSSTPPATASMGGMQQMDKMDHMGGMHHMDNMMGMHKLGVQLIC